MCETSASLLERLRGQPDQADWRRWTELYLPLLRGWLRRHGLQAADVDDLVQDVLAVVVRELPTFQHNRRTGAFRRWLRTILLHRLRDFWRARRSRPRTAGDSQLLRLIEQLSDPNDPLGRMWDEEHDRYLVRRLLEQIEGEVAPSTWKAFRRVVIEGREEETVAGELGMSVNAVFIAKSRVLSRLRRAAGAFLDEIDDAANFS